jgi:hypothetical protein
MVAGARARQERPTPASRALALTCRRLRCLPSSYPGYDLLRGGSMSGASAPEIGRSPIGWTYSVVWCVRPKGAPGPSRRAPRGHRPQESGRALPLAALEGRAPTIAPGSAAFPSGRARSRSEVDASGGSSRSALGVVVTAFTVHVAVCVSAAPFAEGPAPGARGVCHAFRIGRCIYTPPSGRLLDG